MRTLMIILGLGLMCLEPQVEEESDDPIEDTCICDGAQGECRPHPYNVNPIECSEPEGEEE
jgi:hypothetical protein